MRKERTGKLSKTTDENCLHQNVAGPTKFFTSVLSQKRLCDIVRRMCNFYPGYEENTIKECLETGQRRWRRKWKQAFDSLNPRRLTAKEGIWPWGRQTGSKVVARTLREFVRQLQDSEWKGRTRIVDLIANRTVVISKVGSNTGFKKGDSIHTSLMLIETAFSTRVIPATR